MVLADIVVEDEFGNETKDDIALRILKNPNDYLTNTYVEPKGKAIWWALTRSGNWEQIKRGLYKKK